MSLVIAGHPAGFESFTDLISVGKWNCDNSMLAKFTGAGAGNKSELLRWGGGKCSRCLRVVNLKLVSHII